MFKKELQIGGRTLSLETGAVARQANGACVIRYGDTVVLATACYKDGTVLGDFMPLTVDYKEYTYAGGRIPGGFFKREGRPTEKEILTCRLIDRPLRPSFTKGYRQETQIIALVLSADGENDPDILAINAASTALVISEIPFPNPISAVRIGSIDGKIVVNPTNAQRDLCDLDLVVAGTPDAIVMVEAGAREVDEAVVLDAFDAAHAEIRRLCALQLELREACGNKPKLDVTYTAKFTDELVNELMSTYGSRLKDAMLTTGKHPRYAALKALKTEIVASVPTEDTERLSAVGAAWGEMEVQIFRNLMLKEQRRVDGRSFSEIRPITIDTKVLPRTHGSAIFTRGETQALVTVTLGTPQEAQKIEDFEGETHQRFMLHYNFPPFSVGEVKFMRGPARREIGHGNLARRALAALLPTEDEFAYTIRIVSDILESNGSSSMASVCGGSLALMQAGVPMKASVAGVAMGLVTGEHASEVAILSDIAGMEDHEGDMDFKVAGTRKGITALQMDIKVAGLPREIMARALAQAKEGRLHILDKMDAAVAGPSAELSEFAPRLYTVMVPKDRIRDVIGSGGKTIRWIVEETGTKIDVADDGKVTIASSDVASANRAIDIIKGLTASAEIGKNYKGTVKRIEPYGAFVEILPGQDGLLHISEMAHGRVGQVTDVMQIGDEIEVQVVGIEPDSGKIRLSRKPLLPPPTEEEAAAAARAPRRDGPGGGGSDRGGRGGFGDRDRGPRGGGGDRGRGGSGDRGPRRDHDRGPRRDSGPRHEGGPRHDGPPRHEGGPPRFNNESGSSSSSDAPKTGGGDEGGNS
jgi:polyribonucleotide nucleotidyltransferase